MTDESVTEGLIAFWNHDRYPWVLWGKVVRWGRNGHVVIQNLESHMFRPLLILKEEEAEPVIEQLNRMKKGYEEEVERARTKYNQSAEMFFADLDIMPKYLEGSKK